MQLTKFPQSCLKIAGNGGAILVDPGTVATAKYTLRDFGHVDAVLYTHSHSDHLDLGLIDGLLESGATLYGNIDVAGKVGAGRIEVVEGGEELVVAGFKVKAYDMQHCLMVDGSPGVPNTGYLIDGKLLLPGDSVQDVGVSADVLAVPIFGPDISYRDAYAMSQNVKARVVIPVHFDIAEMNPEVFVMLGGQYHPRAQVKIVANGECIELP